MAKYRIVVSGIMSERYVVEAPEELMAEDLARDYFLEEHGYGWDDIELLDVEEIEDDETAEDY